MAAARHEGYNVESNASTIATRGNHNDLQRLNGHRQRGAVEERADNRHQIIQLAGQQRAQPGAKQRADDPGAGP